MERSHPKRQCERDWPHSTIYRFHMAGRVQLTLNAHTFMRSTSMKRSSSASSNPVGACKWLRLNLSEITGPCLAMTVEIPTPMSTQGALTKHVLDDLER